MVAAEEQQERAGNESYQSSHMAAIFQEGFSFSGYERDLFALNVGGKRFLDISGVSGVDAVSDGRGAAFADLDNDGDFDIFLTALQGEAHSLFRNNVGQDRRFLRVELVGARARDAYGATVRVRTSAGTLTKVKFGGSGYVSQSDPRLLFGLGEDAEAAWLEVLWPGGARQRFERIPAGGCVRIVEGEQRLERVQEPRLRLADPLGGADALLAKLGLRRGERLPDLQLRGLDGTPRRLYELLHNGRRHLVNFWATYCVPCAQEMPELQALYPRLERAGVALIGISLDTETVAQVPAYLRERGIRYPVYTTGPETIAALYRRGEMLIPLSLLLDDRGRVVEAFAGWTERSRQALNALAQP